ncbi:hypothetical protein C8Q79DRAFT_926482 [Trametes meyenii]|nr:hypothetical protein C8Q79DRAFT_926482 [Trametes meyenii]
MASQDIGAILDLYSSVFTSGCFTYSAAALINYTIIGTVATVVPVSNAECANLIRATFTINVLQYIPWGAMSALRVLALSRMNWMLSGIVFILSEGPIVINLIQYGYKLGGENVLTTGCQGDETLTPLQGEICKIFQTPSIFSICCVPDQCHSSRYTSHRGHGRGDVEEGSASNRDVISGRDFAV